MNRPDRTEYTTRTSLVARLQNLSDQPAWQEFFDRYWRLIYRTAAQAGLTNAEAQDVVQETVLAVARQFERGKQQEPFRSFKSWLRLITRRRIADQFRKRPRWTSVHGKATTESNRTRTSTWGAVADPDSLDWDGVWELQWRENLVEAAMEAVKKKVSPKQYLLFHQQVERQWSPAKVAREYGVSVASAYMARYRISALLKKEVRRLEQAGF
ncbi:MAG TPA: sigma-70 family RNA polymerase sigma factor [Verrucomicrobiae bacterium]|nr:sigma-70 family RNA polymerase sigma factor [Verrucomicrobiae bacterium]